ncbi:putative O-acetylhomoserine sulfhydrylase [Candidatus Zinderia insecticola CARI]|uniref:Putative O-acetylhomoserine sulfhydrylase n=1 Tax=Zinderia insecticola (strain CARI) TaxID=871271 RepID=E0TIS8_ZINIC|nr:putative O-acetylhomoserine sulfhydrylase [Candidatus Zinderia insecticola CARI]
MKNFGYTTKILYKKNNKIEYGSLHKPIYTSVTFRYKKTKELINVFKNKKEGFRYSRQKNPTVSFLEDKISIMENGIETICFSTGMAAIAAIYQGLLNINDHIISSKFLFGNTTNLWNNIKSKGCKISMVDSTNYKNILKNINNKTKIVFVETISNPITQISDLKKIGKICKKYNILYIIDNTITSPYLFNPKKVNANLIINSLTKSIGGHGDSLGGSLTDTGLYNWKNFSNIDKKFKKYNENLWGIKQIRAKSLRDFGASLSAESAHNILIGLETITFRQNKACFNAFSLANMLKNNKNIKKVYYPGLKNHPQNKIAKKLFKNYGNLLSFEFKKNINYYKYLDNLKIPNLATNLGDNRTLILPIAKTIYNEISKKKKKNMGISESLIRVSLGIEDTHDILNDFYNAFNKL